MRFSFTYSVAFRRMHINYIWICLRFNGMHCASKQCNRSVFAVAKIKIENSNKRSISRIQISSAERSYFFNKKNRVQFMAWYIWHFGYWSRAHLMDILCISFMWNRLKGLKRMQSAPIIHKCVHETCVWIGANTSNSSLAYFTMWVVFVSKLSCLLLPCNTLILCVASVFTCLYWFGGWFFFVFSLSLAFVCFSGCVLIDLNE